MSGDKERANGMWAALRLSKVATDAWKQEGQTDIPHWALTNLFIDEIARLEDKPWNQVVSELNEARAEHFKAPTPTPSNTEVKGAG